MGKANEKREKGKVKRAKDKEVNGQGEHEGKGDTPGPRGAVKATYVY